MTNKGATCACESLFPGDREGKRIRMTRQIFDIREVEEAIRGTEFAARLMHFPSVGSTNDLALEAAQAGVRHGVWIADEQTAGRGRGSHGWHSVVGDGLYMTALVAPPIPMQTSLQLSLRVAIAVQEAIVSVVGFRRRDEIDIRWPNDLLLNGKKVGGILIETAAQAAPAVGPAMLRYAVVGIGINCNHSRFPPEIDAIATSLRRELPQPSGPLRREPLAAAILVALDEEIRLMIRGWRGTDNRSSRDLALYSSWIRDKQVMVDEGGGYSGITAGLDSRGFLRVIGDDGVLHTVISGGVRAR
jgi:BirA family transcriptional regulator, biotin operon repressor / biotin---[acetyl-CoA-carboxylase] ligase